MNEWKRKCPECGEEIPYTKKDSRNRAIKENRSCRSCCKIGKNHPMYGKHHTKKSNYKNSKSNIGKIQSKQILEKISKSKSGVKCSSKHKKNISENHSHYWQGKTFSGEHRKNLRISAIERIKKQKGQIQPNYNLSAIPIILQKAKELDITDLQHAENGGEYQVCGYFVDGYSLSKNIVIEYYEPFHKKQVERDEQRKREIIKELGCKFIEIKE